MESRPRIASLRSRLEREGVAAIGVTHPVNVAYLTGFEDVFDNERAHVALVTADTCVLFTDSRYAQAAREAAEGTPWQVQTVSDAPWSQVAETLDTTETLAIEDTVEHRTYLDLEERLEPRIVPASGWIEDLRATKSAEEIARIEQAQSLTDAAFEHILSMVRAGVSEREVAFELECFMRRNGSDGVAFDPIVASGPNSARPHAKVTDRVIERGDFVKMDFGARMQGYCADMTRTVVVGSASDRQKEIYAAVLAANAAGIGAVSPGSSGQALDAAARQVIESAGFGANFGHGLGHGVGREVHELPGVGPRSTRPVPAGSVITIEPGVYLEGFGGVRIEDLVVVEEGGARVLSRSPKSLLEL